jgi:hypothetical protein
MFKFNREILICFILFLVVLITHFLSPATLFTDTKWCLHVSQSILREGNVTLNEYFTLAQATEEPALQIINNQVHSLFPLGASLIALPLVGVLELTGVDVIRHSETIQLFIASFVIALTAVFIYRIARQFLNIGYALLLVFVFAYCTSAWSTGSRTLWQHGPSMLMLTITLYLLVLARERPYLCQFASISLGLSLIMRPTNFISITLLSLFVLLQYRQYFLKYLAWSLPVAVPFLLFNFLTYGTLFPSYYLGAGGKGVSLRFVQEALIGNLISPARGIFVFSPILLLSVLGILLKERRKEVERLDYFLFLIITLHWVLISFVLHWWGGHSYGPRFFSDMLPYFVYFLIPVFSFVSSFKSSTPRNWRQIALITVICLFIGISFFIHFRGSTSYAATVEWNQTPFDIDYLPTQKIWDVRDLQFLRGL